MTRTGARRPACVVNLADLPGETRPRFTKTPGVGAIVRPLGDAVGLTRMGVGVREVAPGFAGTNRHFHTVEEEWAFVLSGRAVARIGPLRIGVGPGCFVGFPPGPRPHHFLAEGDEPLVFLEGGERRPAEDGCWYPDARVMSQGRKAVEPYEEPPPEEGEPTQVQHIDDLDITAFQHDVDPGALRKMRALHRATGLLRQAVYWARVERGDRSTAYHTHERTDEWVFVLSGHASVRVGTDRFEVGPYDFLGHPAGGPPHVMEATETLIYLMGGQIDPEDVVLYPEAGLRRVHGRLTQEPGRDR
jgi:uncharacterized cupin superfamily protein